MLAPVFVAFAVAASAWGLTPDRKNANALDPTLLPLGGDRFRVYYSVAAAGQQLTGPYHVASGVLARRAVSARSAKKKDAKRKHKKKP